MIAGSPRFWLVTGGLAGAGAVVVGALAAHVVDPIAAQRLETAVRYQMWHALALLAVAWLSTTPVARWAGLAGWFFLAGLLLFCATLQVAAFTGMTFLLAGAPAGGLAFIAGWLMLAFAGLRWRSA